jgi:hypothetical protein
MMQVGQSATCIIVDPMFLVVGNAMSATGGGQVVAPDAVRVDYVRVWK